MKNFKWCISLFLSLIIVEIGLLLFVAKKEIVDTRFVVGKEIVIMEGSKVAVFKLLTLTGSIEQEESSELYLYYRYNIGDVFNFK